MLRALPRKVLFPAPSTHGPSRMFCGERVRLTVEEFAHIDLRVGEILQCQNHPESDKLYYEAVRISEDPEVVRKIGTGLQKLVPILEMRGKVLVMANLKPRKLAGLPSQGMLMCATNAEGHRIQLLRPQGQIGERIYPEGYPQLFGVSEADSHTLPLLKTLNQKRKLLQKSLPDFKTDAEGLVTWNNIRLRTRTGFITTSIPNAWVS